MKNLFAGLGTGIVVALLYLTMVLMILAPEIFVAFLILKLVGVLTFGWFWVFSPLIFGAILITIYLCLVIIIGSDN